MASLGSARCKSYLELPKLAHLTGPEIGYVFWESGLKKKKVWKIVYIGLKLGKGFQDRAAHSHQKI